MATFPTRTQRAYSELVAIANLAEVIQLVGLLARKGEVADEEIHEQIAQLGPHPLPASQALPPEGQAAPS